jgi:hypothetical protein
MKHHPQLTRFYSQAAVQGAIAAYLREVEMAIGQGEAAAMEYLAANA